MDNAPLLSIKELYLISINARQQRKFENVSKYIEIIKASKWDIERHKISCGTEVIMEMVGKMIKATILL